MTKDPRTMLGDELVTAQLAAAERLDLARVAVAEAQQRHEDLVRQYWAARRELHTVRGPVPQAAKQRLEELETRVAHSHQWVGSFLQALHTAAGRHAVLDAELHVRTTTRRSGSERAPGRHPHAS